MARSIRIEYAGAVYHIISRGDRQEAIFRDQEDFRSFLETLAEMCKRTGIRIHAYALMGNHYHLLMETPEPILVAGMKWFQGAYTQRFNRRLVECEIGDGISDQYPSGGKGPSSDSRSDAS